VELSRPMSLLYSFLILRLCSFKQVHRRRYESRRLSEPKRQYKTKKINKIGEKRFPILHTAMWHNHDIDFARWLHPAMWQVALGWHAMEFVQTSAVLEFYIRFRFLPYHRSRHVILHQSVKFYPNRTTLGRIKWRRVDFQDGGSLPSWILGVQ